jgi:hypothetical protein
MANHIYLAATDDFLPYARLALKSMLNHSMPATIFCDRCDVEYSKVPIWLTRQAYHAVQRIPRGDWLIKIDADMLFYADIAGFVNDRAGDVVITTRQYKCKFSINAGIWAVRHTFNGLSFMREFVGALPNTAEWWDDQNYLCAAWDRKDARMCDAGPLWNWTIEKDTHGNIPEDVKVVHFNRQDKSDMIEQAKGWHEIHLRHTR